MKQILLTILVFILLAPKLTAQQSDPVVITINDKSIHLSDFEAAYKKNNLDSAETKGDIKSFLESYVNSKLSLEEALTQRLDTTASYKYQYDSYRIQTISPYLKEDDYEKSYMDDIYSRSLENVELNHVLIPFEENKIFPEDTLKIYNEALKMTEKLKLEGFSRKGFSDHSASREMVLDLEQKNGYLGWVAPFMLSTPVENAAYTIPAGEISAPIRTHKGYHIIQVLGRRSDVGYRTIDQVLFSFTHIPPSQNEIDSVMGVVAKIYETIKSDADFQLLCDGFAEAYGRREQGCSFGEITLDTQLPPSFIKAAFELQHVGDISTPVVSNYGVHILRLVSQRLPLQNEMKHKFREKMVNGDRSFYFSLDFQKYLFKKYNLVVNENSYQQLVDIANRIYPTDSTFANYVNNGRDELFTVDREEKYDVKGFVEYLKTQKEESLKESEGFMTQIFGNTPMNPFNLSTDRLAYFFRRYAALKMRDYLMRSIDKKNLDVKKVVDEYSEGILIFDAMNNNIWKKAKTDEDGLSAFYQKNKSKYKWNKPRFKGYIISCDDQEMLDKVIQVANSTKKKENLGEIIRNTFDDDQMRRISIREGLWAKGQNEYIDYKIFSGAEPSDKDKYLYSYVFGELAKSPQGINDVKGEVVADYQDKLEREWFAGLRKKYNVTVDENALKSIQE